MVQDAKMIKQNGSPELNILAMSKEVPVSLAVRIAKLPRDEQVKVLSGGAKEVKRKAKELNNIK